MSITWVDDATAVHGNLMPLPLIELFAIYGALFFVSKLTSWAVYQACWRNAIGCDFRVHSATTRLISRWRIWPFHLLMVSLTLPLSWQDLPDLRFISIVVVTLMTVGAVFRFGAVDWGNFFWSDRLLAIALNVGCYFTPAFLYPLIMVVCCLQYTVSAWRLGPGYSNLLGFEFVRGSANATLGCFAVSGGILHFTTLPVWWEPLLFAVILGVQASHYVNHGLAKAFLGRRPHSWVLHNRVECLVVNAYLRGWEIGLGRRGVLRLAKLIRRFRVPLCASVFALELGFALLLLDLRIAVVLLLSAAAFHFSVFILTGLSELEYIVSHLAWTGMAVMSSTSEFKATFAPAVMFASVTCMSITFLWVGWNRTRMFRRHQQSGSSANHRLADPFDHLMAWWDSPCMRMYSYVVLTEDGHRLWLPVPKLSPYDTALTDIHTHIMLLNAHSEFDPQTERDKQFARTGVWGLVVTERERDRLYGWMDSEGAEQMLGESGSLWRSIRSSEVWRVSSERCVPEQAKALWRLFDGINRYRVRWWYRLIMRFPHFPGEDLVPDVSPLATGCDGVYDFRSPIVGVEIQCIKTFYTGEEIQLVEQSELGVVELP